MLLADGYRLDDLAQLVSVVRKTSTFAPQATDPGRFEDYARRIYPERRVKIVSVAQKVAHSKNGHLSMPITH
jgi:hypothetical protein